MDIKAGKKFLKEKNYIEAEKIFLNLIKHNNDLLLSNFYLGGIYFELDNYDKSKLYYEKALKFSKDSKEVLINLAFLEQSYGKLISAKKIYQKLIKLYPNYIEAYYRLYLLNPKNLNLNQESFFHKLLEDKNISLHNKSLANYLISKINKQKGNYNVELSHLKKSQNYIFESNKEYNLQSNFYYEKIISKKYNKIKFENTDKIENLRAYSPIFIIGLPRSGSTLIETLLSSNKSVVPIGENSIINMGILNQISNKIFVKTLDLENFSLSLDCEKLSNYVCKKIKQIEKLKNKNNIYFVDKTLVNFFNIETILYLFPNAHFVHCYRNYKDSIIAIYQSLLPTLSWTHNLDHIIGYIDNYIKTMNYFKSKYSDKIFDIKLEHMTENKKELSKKLFKFCGLNWNDKFLNFKEKNDLAIKTSSNVQLRDNINKYDYNKYSNYHFILEKYEKDFGWLSKEN
mgnify:FL=1